MNNEMFLQEVKKSQEKSLELMRAKNQDYAGGCAFKNFDVAAFICNVSSEKGILIRMCDKITRIGNLLNNKERVKDETIEDTLLDLANYSYILMARIKARKKDVQRNE